MDNLQKNGMVSNGVGSNTIRDKFLQFYKARGHAIIPSAPLIPQNDPTTLFTGSGMQPLVPYLLGKEHPEGSRLVNSQKSFRSGDIEEVGDNRHTTFFEMLGNWSLGDYFKQEQLPWVFEFLTKEVGLDPQKLYVTVFIGDEANNIPKDTESVALWKEIFSGVGIDAKDVEIGSEEDGYEKGMQDGRIFYYNAKKNWWSRSGVPENMPVGEPGGPDSEIFYDFGTQHDTKWGSECHPNCDCGRFLEIGNSVFMQYIKQEDDSFALLPKQNVDFGGGLERIAAAENNNPDVFTTSLFQPLFAEIQRVTGIAYATSDTEQKRALRIVADHLRAAVFLIADGVVPNSSDQGYFVRRLLRRAIRYAEMLGIKDIASLVSFITEQYTVYINFDHPAHDIKWEIEEEEKVFRATLQHGMKKFDKETLNLEQAGTAIGGKLLAGKTIFDLVTTHGMPLELIQEIANERGICIDIPGFEREMSIHKEISRVGSEQKFKGGLADASEATTRLHTTHHLLLKALQMVLGDHVHQRGSNITAERLRIDFANQDKMTDAQKAEVERIVNEQIDALLPVTRSLIPREEAEKLHAEHEFGAKYPDTVSVYSVGPIGATEANPQFDQAFSIEFCGGPHVTNTSEIAKSGHFHIQKEEASSAGIRRIKGILS